MSTHSASNLHRGPPSPPLDEPPSNASLGRGDPSRSPSGASRSAGVAAGSVAGASGRRAPATADRATGDPRTGRGPFGRAKVGRGLPALLLAAGLATACGGGTEGDDELLEALAAGVYLDYERPVGLGRPPKRGDLPEGALLVPLPVGAGDGWQPASRGGWLPIGERATLDYRLRDPRPGERSVLRLDLRYRPIEDGPQKMGLRVGDREVQTVSLEPRRSRHFFTLDPAPSDSSVDIELLFDPPLRRPPKSKPTVTLIGIGLGRDERSLRGPLAFASPPAVDRERRLLRFARSGRLIARLPATRGGAGAVTFEARCGAGGGSFEISWLDRAGRVLESAGRRTCGATWEEVESAPGGTTPAAALALEVLLDGPSSRLEIASPSLAGSPGAPPAAQSTAGPKAAATGLERLPDIVVIVLDAARAAHFGYAGYHRDTTPQIDRLAADSLVFSSAYSECPNTACSIPNLITGVPFINVGTVFKGRRIPDQLKTLAEYLEPLGYSRVGFSANPNNSTARNSHQGFEYFERLWGAHRQADRAREVIEAQPADRPLYLQLHLLPPHQPYMPEPEFDLFTDPDYRGPVHPKVGLRRYTAGHATFSGADLEQLVALYDGNLRMADDAVGRVLETLRRAGRFDGAIVVLTSDHGEAFGEHGQFQHNSSVFDEMLHVPLVIRLPGGEVPSHVDTERPVALADLVPTLLGYLGLEPRSEVWGRDLLAPGPPAERFLFHRTHHLHRPLLAARDASWKAITARNLRHPILLDLAADPDETTNVVLDHPETFAVMALTLRDFIADWRARVPESNEDVELTPEEVELLRSLGYVE